MKRKPRTYKEKALRDDFEELNAIMNARPQQFRKLRKMVKKQMTKLDRKLNRQELELGINSIF